MRNPARHRPRLEKGGFTLIELSIVLVIIGLIVGGVLAGRELIEAAKIRKQISQINEYSVGVTTFKLKYNHLPGDIPYRAASGFGLPTENSSQFNGNGQINGQMGANPYSSIYREPTYFFPQLSAANLISGGFAVENCCAKFGSGHRFADMAINPQSGILPVTWEGGLWFFLGLSNAMDYGGAAPVGNHWIYQVSTQGVLSALQAYGIDSKLDDGIPSTGTVLALDLSAGVLILDTTANECALTNTATAYNVTSDDKHCRLLVRMR